MRRIGLVVSVLLLAGCGGTGAAKVVRQTAQNIRDIRSGVLHVKMLVKPHGAKAQPFGFELEGPFSLGQNGSPPLAHLSYTQIVNGKQATASLVLGRNSGSITTNGSTHALTASAFDSVRGAARSAGAESKQFLPVEKWVTHATLHSCGANECVTGQLDVVKATNDLLSIGRALGRDLPVLTGANEDQLRKAVRSGTFELVTGKTDRLLHRLSIRLDLGLNVPQELTTALGRVVGAKFTLDFSIDRPNSTAVSG